MENFPEIVEVLNSPLDKFITFAANDFGCSGSAHDIMVNRVHPLFFKYKAAASKADNRNWWQAMNGPFANEYWKDDFNYIETLEVMEAWEVVDRTEDMHVIDSTWDF